MKASFSGPGLMALAVALLITVAILLPVQSIARPPTASCNCVQAELWVDGEPVSFWTVRVAPRVGEIVSDRSRARLYQVIGIEHDWDLDRNYVRVHVTPL